MEEGHARGSRDPTVGLRTVYSRLQERGGLSHEEVRTPGKVSGSLDSDGQGVTEGSGDATITLCTIYPRLKVVPAEWTIMGAGEDPW